MTITIAIIGKSGSGKTTVTKSITTLIHNLYPNKSILLVDNDLTGELGNSFGINVNNTIFDLRFGIFRYKTKLPEQMSRQEFIEWSMQDLIHNLYDDVDLIVTGPVSTKDCSCVIASQINDSLVKLVKSYDIAIFDCEYDLEYLFQTIDYSIDTTLIVAEADIASIYVSGKIKESSLKHSSPGQIGLLLNKVNNRQIPENILQLLNEYDLNLLGSLPCDEKLIHENIKKDSTMLVEALREILFRLNLPLQ